MTQNKSNLFKLCLRLGDTSLILGHRLSELCGHGPILEEDIALTNISLDLIGQARIILNYAGTLEDKPRSEDELAYLRDVGEFYNALLAEQSNGDFAKTMVRQFLISSYQYFLFEALSASADATLAAFASKSLKEVSYHMRHAADWVLRLGDGTAESHLRTQKAIDELWMFTGDLFDFEAIEKVLAKEGVIPDLAAIPAQWRAKVDAVFNEANLTVKNDTWMASGSHVANHTEHLGFILAEMQFLPRAYPGNRW